MSDHALERLRSWGADTAIILGSGLAPLVGHLPTADRVPYAEFPDLPTPGIAGHPGEFTLADLNGRKILFAKGRVHLYEGHSARAVAAGIRLLALAGIKRLVLTNAAGTANPDFAPGSWMMLRDHLNLTGTSPLIGAPEFIDMTDVYSSRWRRAFVAAAESAGVRLHEGVYAGLPGPQYETPAEVRMLQTLGADAIGMSTVLETIQARALRMEVAGFSCLTNWAAGLSGQQLSHAEVLAVGEAAAADFSRLFKVAFAVG